jgi:hypothetical protein
MFALLLLARQMILKPLEDAPSYNEGETLPEQFFIGADKTYTLSNKILISFKGSQRQEQYNSSLNFYLSQLVGIRIGYGRSEFQFSGRLSTSALMDRPLTWSL